MRTSILVLTMTAFLPSLASAANSEHNFGGVGIDGAPLADGRIAVRQIVRGGPADQAGIRAGDIIIQIDGTPTQGGDFQTLVQKRLRGRAGTPVMLKLRRSGEEQARTVHLVRRQLTMNPRKEKAP